MDPIETVMRARVCDIDTATTTLVAAMFAYRSDDPYAVTLTVPRTEAVTAQWRFTRDMLAAGMAADVSVGPVGIYPGNPDYGDDVGLTLAGITPLLVELPRLKVRRFLRRSYAAVAVGSEHLFDGSGSIDEAIARLLNDTR